MSKLLDSVLDPERRAQCAQGDADLLAGLHRTMQQALAPLFITPATVAAVAATSEARRAAYVSALIRFDWTWEFAEVNAWRKGRDGLQRLRAEQAQVDPTGDLWRKHAPVEYHSHLTVGV